MNRNKIKIFLVILFSFPIIVIAQKRSISINGIYNGLGSLYIITDNSEVKGYFQNYRGERNNFSTIFFFVGKRADNNNMIYEIKTFYPGDMDTIKGTCKILNPKNLEITLDETPPGDVFSINHNKDNFEIVKEKNWKGIGYIISNKVRLMPNPNNLKKSISYITKNDCVAILKKDNIWVQVEYIGKNRNRIGWILSEQIKIL